MNALETEQGTWTMDAVRSWVAAAMIDERHPRVHPNGFIQLDLEPVAEEWEKKEGHSGAAKRLHIWNPPGVELPHQETVNEIHDHVFDMRSTVVRGVLIQKLYEFVVGGTSLTSTWDGEIREGERLPVGHEIYQAVYDQKSSSRLEPTGIRGHLRQTIDLPVVAGKSYTQPAFTIHDSDPDGCVVTVMEKMAVHEGTPVVICPVDQSPDNEFDRASAASVDLLWKAISASVS